jgi:hypothetical protein
MTVSWNRANGGPTSARAGNSLGAAIVGGVARLAMQAHPEWDAATLRSWLHQTARKLGNRSATEYGYGMPDAVCLIAMTAPCVRFSVNVSGPSNLYTGGTYTWTASIADDGGNTYSYVWEQSYNGTSGWSQVGTNSPTHQITFAPHPGGYFTIYLRVTATTSGQPVTSSPYAIHILFK